MWREINWIVSHVLCNNLWCVVEQHYDRPIKIIFTAREQNIFPGCDLNADEFCRIISWNFIIYCERAWKSFESSGLTEIFSRIVENIFPSQFSISLHLNSFVQKVN